MDMKRDLEIDLLRAFVAVAANRNFTLAARSVGRTQSAVSMQIKRLEEIVGKRLFERSRQSVSVTNVGETLLVYANRILAANDAALSHIQRPEAEGLIRIGAPDDYATFLLPPILASLSEEHPRLQFEVICDNASALIPKLETRELDIVLATHASNAIAGEIARFEPLHWVAAPDYVSDPEAPLTLVLFPVGCVCRDIALAALRRLERTWRVSYSTRSIGLMESAIRENSGVSVMEASIIPTGLKILDGQSGFPPLPDVAISVHRSHNGAAHVSLTADYIRTSLERPAAAETA